MYSIPDSNTPDIYSTATDTGTGDYLDSTEAARLENATSHYSLLAVVEGPRTLPSPYVLDVLQEKNARGDYLECSDDTEDNTDFGFGKVEEQVLQLSLEEDVDDVSPEAIVFEWDSDSDGSEKSL